MLKTIMCKINAMRECERMQTNSYVEAQVREKIKAFERKLEMAHSRYDQE